MLPSERFAGLPRAGILGALMLLVGLASALAIPVGAQQGDGESYSVYASFCEAPPPQPPGFAGGDCVPAEGVVIEVVAAEGGQSFGACTTTAAEGSAPLAGCSVVVPYDTPLLLYEDESTVPAGYAPRENPLQGGSVSPAPPQGERLPPFFINLPVDSGMGTDAADSGDTSDGVDATTRGAGSGDNAPETLPTTGTGVRAGDGGPAWFGGAALAIIAGAVFGLRSRPAPRAHG